MTFVLIPAGSFQRGSPEGDGEDDEHPRRELRISRPFYLSMYEVTQGQYLDVTGKNPSWFSANGGGKQAVRTPSTDQHPVETVSWFDAIRFANMLSEKEGLAPYYTVAEPSVQVPDWAGPGYRLPTEAEWEYACRASSQMRYSFSDVATELSHYAWFSDFSGQVTHPVGQKLANNWGLYDMHGNVWEWCWDWYSADYYKHSQPVDARGPEQANLRVRRGGSFGDNPAELRSAVRTRLQPIIRSRFVGFRLAKTCD
jgi:formylglycine-generating enzyme required for sulfatase activity